jgi:hypothetical protein
MMARIKKNSEADVVNSFRFSLMGLILFSLCLMAGTVAISCRIFEAKAKTQSSPKLDNPDPDAHDGSWSTHQGPWGELATQDIMLERPQEYFAPEAKILDPETWKFNNLNLAQVKEFLAAHGLTKEVVEAQLTPNRIVTKGTATIVTPDEDFLLSMTPETRGKLYGSMYGLGVGQAIDYPLIFSKHSLETIYSDPRLNAQDVALLKRLIYPAGNSERFSDNELLQRKIPTADRRVMIMKVLSKQPAVLAQLCVRPDTDIDKIAAYWGKMDNVHFTDMRPMLEALKRLPQGGTISLVHFLPPFARTRLYTYPLPPEPNAPAMDCHWTTLNFCNVEPDNRFSNPAYAAEFIRTNFYQISSPSVYGDIVLYFNKDNGIAHSAVFLADDLAFTKYGDNFLQPWMVVHLADMQAMYPALKPVFLRRKAS